MGTINKFRKALAFGAVALLAAACGSTEPGVTDDDSGQTAEVAPDEGPAEGFQRVTFNFSPEEVIEDVYQGDLSTFEVRSASDDETIVVGFLDDTGTIDVPSGMLRETIGVEAELPDDEFCWWSGFHTTIDSASVITIDVELDEVCA